MRMFASLTRRRVLWACLALAVAAALYSYPTIDSSTRLYFAEKALLVRKAEDAIDWLESIPDHRTDGKREFLLARSYRRLGQQELSREHLQIAFELGFPVEKLEREQWMALAQSGQMREAEPHLRKLLQDPGEDGQEICESFVKGYFRNRQLSKAIPILDAWQAEFPDDPQPHAFRGAGYQESEDWTAAIAEYQKVLKLTPDATDVRVQLAICLKARLKFDEAIVEFRKCLVATPQDKILLAEWGDVLLSTGTAAEASAVFQQLLAIDPMNAEARLAMSGIHLMNGKPEEALALAQSLYAERPYDKRVMHTLASALQVTGKPEEATEMFKRVDETQAKLLRKNQLLEELQRDPNQVDQRFEIAMITMNYQSPADGARWLLSVIDLDPGYAAAYAALADYYKTINNGELEQKFRALAESHANGRARP